jgi:predicted NBD/HSP70 family sugar kinase
MDMTNPHCLQANADFLARFLVDRLRDDTRDGIRSLQVMCDDDVITVGGEVASYYVWQLGFASVRKRAHEAGGLLFDYQVRVSR